MIRLPFLLPALLSLCLVLASPAVPRAEVAASTPAVSAETSGPQHDDDALAVQQAWEALLATHNAQLSEIFDELRLQWNELPAITDATRSSLASLEQEFEKLNTLTKVNGSMPSDLTVLIERFSRIRERILAVAAPLRTALDKLSEQKSALTLLDSSLKAQEKGTGDTKVKNRLIAVQKSLRSLTDRYESALAPADKLRNIVEARMKSLSEQMPTLWKNHYFQSSGHFYDVVAWAKDIRNLGSMKELFALRLSTEVPNSLGALLFVFIRIASTMAFFMLLMAGLRSKVQALPDKMRGGVKRILLNSLVWIALGVAIHVGAWSDGRLYQMIAALGTMCLCWGQMTLAWDLYDFQNPDRPRRSPLWPMFPPLFIGMILLNFDPFPLFIAVVWVVVQGVDLWLAYRRPLPEDRLSAAIMQIYIIQLWVTLVISLLGFSRLSILLSMAFTSAVVTIMLCVSLFKVENLIEAHLPSEGSASIVSSLIMALVMPVVLLAAVMASVLWIFAYPGGYFLIKHLATLGFSVGDVSLNAMQILSIFIAFYLTRTLLVVGNTFMAGMQSQISRISVSLLAPLQIIYKCVLWAVFGLYALNALGFNLSSLTVIAGGLSVGIGLGMQNMVQDFTSGLSVIFGQTIREGDVVEVDGITGTVKKINIRATMVQTFDNAIVFIPNASFLKGTFTNWTHNDRRVRKEILVGVAYGSDVDQCMKLMLDIAKAHPQVLYYPEPSTLFMNFGASSLDLALRFWTSYDVGASVTSEIRLKINQVFEANGIEISFPQMDLHLRSGDFKIAPAALQDALTAGQTGGSAPKA